MAEPQIMSAQEYGRSVLGYAEGQSIKGKELAKFRDQYARYVQSASKSFTPTAIAVTNPVNTNQVVPMIMTSPGSAMPFPQPGFKEGRVNDQGVALVFDDRTGTYFPATNTATQTAVKPDPRSNNLEDLMALMSGPQGAAPAAPSRLASFFGFGGGAPTPSPTPSPTPMATPAATPMPTPMATPAATPMPAMAGTNAPAPALSTPEAVRAAFLAGQISEAQAVQMLRGGR